MNISSMRIGRKIIASSGHDQKNIYVIKQVVQKTEKQNEKKVEVPSSSLMKHNNNNNHDTAKSLKLKYARKYGWRERAMKNIMVAKRSGLRRRQAAAVNTVTSRNCAKHNHYRLEMAVEYSDKAIFKKVENEDKIIFQPDILPVKKFVVPFGGLRNYK